MLKKTPFILLIAAALFILDLMTKMMIRYYTEVRESIPIIQDFFHITHVQNTGAGFSILTGYNSVLIGVYLAAIVAMAFSWKSLPENKWTMGFMGLLLGGIVGNLVDRIFFGYVTDFIDFRIWPVFNIADSAITIGVFGFVLYEIYKSRTR